MKPFNRARYLALGLTLLFAASCGRFTELGEDDIANALGDNMSSVDESLVGGGTLSQFELDEFASCGFTVSDFSSCAAGIRTRTFGGCTLLSAVVTGTVTLTFSQTACTFSSSGDTITRAPNFTLTGRRSRTLTVSVGSGGFGQRITRGAAAGSYTVATSKMKRVATNVAGETILNLEASTGTGMTLTGSARSGRKLDGGTLIITDSLNSKTYTLTPESVTWDGTCNCASSGSWTGNIATSGSSSTTTIQVAITACGSADVTLGDVTSSVTLDRCASL